MVRKKINESIAGINNGVTKKSYGPWSLKQYTLSDFILTFSLQYMH